MAKGHAPQKIVRPSAEGLAESASAAQGAASCRRCTCGTRPFAAISTCDRPRRHLVLPGHADRPAGAGAAVLDDPEARGRRHFLVTPVEKVGIIVEDAPFVAVDFEAGDGQALTFVTNVGDRVTAGPDHPIRVERDPETGEPAPYVLVRAGLEALIDRKSFYRLVELGEHRQHEGARWFGLRSGGAFFPIIPSAELPD